MQHRKIEFDDDIPVGNGSRGTGRREARYLRRALETMAVGQSFKLIDGEEYVYVIGTRINSSRKNSALYGRKFSILRDPRAPGTYRVWRVL